MNENIEVKLKEKHEITAAEKSIGSLTPMLAQYIEIKRVHSNYLLFYRMGDFYELFFEDAKVASDALDITLTKRGKKDNKEIPMCGVPVHELQKPKLAVPINYSLRAVPTHRTVSYTHLTLPTSDLV